MEAHKNEDAPFQQEQQINTPRDQEDADEGTNGQPVLPQHIIPIPVLKKRQAQEAENREQPKF